MSKFTLLSCTYQFNPSPYTVLSGTRGLSPSKLMNFSPLSENMVSIAEAFWQECSFVYLAVRIGLTPVKRSLVLGCEAGGGQFWPMHISAWFPFPKYTTPSPNVQPSQNKMSINTGHMLSYLEQMFEGAGCRGNISGAKRGHLKASLRWDSRCLRGGSGMLPDALAQQWKTRLWGGWHTPSRPAFVIVHCWWSINNWFSPVCFVGGVSGFRFALLGLV